MEDSTPRHTGKLETRGLWKVFGSKPDRAVEMADGGATRAEILDATGCTVGVRDVSLSVEPGETFVVMGLSGSGKSTLVRCISRLTEPTRGQVVLDGVDLTAMDDEALRELRRKKLSMVFQHFGLFPHRLVIDNAAYGLEVQGIGREERRARAQEILEIVGLISVPIGVYAGRNARLEAALSPILDALQTIPSLVYIIPVVTLFTVGVVPGIIATVAYAMVPGVRITALGIREVPVESLEASTTFGATPRQTMLGVRIPLAAPTIMAAINQVIMLSLAMVIISGLVGGGALGFETVRALKRSLFGFGFEVGLALALMAMLIDRFTEAVGNNLRPPSS